MKTTQEAGLVVQGDVVSIRQQADGRVRVEVLSENHPGVPAEPNQRPGGGPVPEQRKKTKPGLWTPSDIGLLIASAISAALVVALILHQLLGSPGWLADLAAWYLLFIGLVYFTAREQLGHLAARDRVATVVIATGAGLLVVPLLSLLGYVFAKGLPSLRLTFFTTDLGGVAPGAPATEGGALHAIIGTLQQAGIALVIVLPLGVLTAVFLNETRSKLRRPVRIVVDAMSGLPSIVAGLFIYSALIIHPPLNIPLFNFNGFMASLALAMVMLPTVTRTVDVVLRLVPAGLREASLALGASRARTVWSIVLPTARSGVTTAVVLGLARIVGETAPLLFTSFGNTLLNTNPFKDPQESLPFFVYRLVKLPSETDSERGYIGAVVLIMLVLMLFSIARLAGRPKKSK